MPEARGPRRADRAALLSEGPTHFRRSDVQRHQSEDVEG